MAAQDFDQWVDGFAHTPREDSDGYNPTSDLKALMNGEEIPAN